MNKEEWIDAKKSELLLSDGAIKPIPTLYPEVYQTTNKVDDSGYYVSMTQYIIKIAYPGIRGTPKPHANWKPSYKKWPAWCGIWFRYGLFGPWHQGELEIVTPKGSATYVKIEVLGGYSYYNLWALYKKTGTIK